MDDCRKCKYKEACHSIQFELTCEEVRKVVEHDWEKPKDGEQH